MRLWKRNKEHLEKINDNTKRTDFELSTLLKTIDSELIPCPFCGNHPQECHIVRKTEQKTWITIECMGCRARVPPIEFNCLEDLHVVRTMWNHLTEHEVKRKGKERTSNVKRERAASDERCVHCSMPKEHMIECASKGNCQRLRNLLGD